MVCLRCAWLVPVVLGALAPVGLADQAPWFDPDWTVRRVVEATVGSAGQLGDEVAVAEFYTGGMARPGAADVRVAVQGRRLVKHRVLQAGPGDFVRVAFEAMPSLSRYYIYYGNPTAERAEDLEIKRGALLEVREWHGGGQPKKLDQVRRAWEKAEAVGAIFVPTVSLGYNPLMDSRRPAMLHFVGWFVPPRPGTYSFATSSRGGSWLLIDGQEVVSWPGSHGPARRARHAKEIVLTQQPHRLDYWNISCDGQTTAVAVVSLPDREKPRYRPIPAGAFLPVHRAELVEMDLKGEKAVADFFPTHAGEAWWPDHYAVRMRFDNFSKGISERRGGSFQWNFGDGQSSTAAEPTHVYLAPGDYQVTLRASRGTLSNTFRTTVRVDRDWRRQAEREIDPIDEYAREVARYDFAKLDLSSLALAVDLFDHEQMVKPLIAAASELALNREKVGEEQVVETGLLLGGHLREAGQHEKAVQAYRRLEGRVARADRKVRFAVQVGETYLRDLRQYDAAAEAYQRVLKMYGRAGAAWQLRRAHIGMGDIWRHRGDGEKARQAYEAARDIQVAARPPNVQAVRVGTLARYVEEYTREREWEWAFEYLDTWAWEFPLAKIEGHWSLLRARALLARGEKEEALREALDLVGANPHSAYAVRLLMLAAEVHVDLGDRRKARLMLQTAVEDYPEDPHRDEARRRLRALGGPVETSAGAGR